MKIMITGCNGQLGNELQSILKTGKAKAIRLSTMNEICRILKCQPGDLFEYVEDDDPWKR